MIRFIAAATGTLILFVLAPSVAFAQRAPAGRVPVTVAVTASANFGQDIVILRRPDAASPNLILMSRAAATPEHLAAAATSLALIMRRDGDQPAARGLFRVDLAARASAREARAAGNALRTLAPADVSHDSLSALRGARTARIYLPSHPAPPGGAGAR